MFYGIIVMIIVICLGAYISTKLKGDSLYLCGFIIGYIIGLISNIIT